MTETRSLPASLATTPLHALHLARGARMVPFAGYEMPVQYEGIIAEHLHTRAMSSISAPAGSATPNCSMRKAASSTT